jgi:RNA 2',3'-cyclic 3'-phosphodiesterase
LPGFRWHVDELVLIHSLVGHTEHRVLGRWALGRNNDAQLPLL